MTTTLIYSDLRHKYGHSATLHLYLCFFQPVKKEKQNLQQNALVLNDPHEKGWRNSLDIHAILEINSDRSSFRPAYCYLHIWESVDLIQQIILRIHNDDGIHKLTYSEADLYGSLKWRVPSLRVSGRSHQHPPPHHPQKEPSSEEPSSPAVVLNDGAKCLRWITITCLSLCRSALLH